MKLIWHGYLVSSLGICVHETPTETDLTLLFSIKTGQGSETSTKVVETKSITAGHYGKRTCQRLQK